MTLPTTVATAFSSLITPCCNAVLTRSVCTFSGTPHTTFLKWFLSLLRPSQPIAAYKMLPVTLAFCRSSCHSLSLFYQSRVISRIQQ